MFHRAENLTYRDGMVLEVTFQNGAVRQYDMAKLVGEDSRWEPLQDREFFLSGRLLGGYAIVWDDELDLETETVYTEGRDAKTEEKPIFARVGEAIAAARVRAGMTQRQLAAATSMAETVIEGIENGDANPTVGTLDKIARALHTQLSIAFVAKK